MTLQELTGQESGIVIYPNRETIVCNWSSLEENELPRVLNGLAVIGYPEEDEVFEGAESADTEDFRTSFPDEMNVIWDENGDLKSIADGTYYWKDDFRATIYTLRNGTVIIAPPLWN